MLRKPKRDPERENRISMEIIPDAKDEEEVAMGWYSYLQDQIRFPFVARGINRRASSPLRVDDEVEVLDLSSEDECEHEMFVTIRWEKKGLAVPLAQLKPITSTDEQTKLAVSDWQYWVDMGYGF